MNTIRHLNNYEDPIGREIMGVLMEDPQTAAADTSIEEEGNLVDGSGLYLAGCPMKHNADSPALENYQDVVIYFGSGRRAIGFPKGMLYLMKEAFIISIGRPSIMNTPKTEQLWIQ